MIRFPVAPNSSFSSFLPSFLPVTTTSFLYILPFSFPPTNGIRIPISSRSAPHLGDRALSSLVLSSASSLPTASVKFDFPFTSSQAIWNSDQFHRQGRTSHILGLVYWPLSFPHASHAYLLYSRLYSPSPSSLSFPLVLFTVAGYSRAKW